MDVLKFLFRPRKVLEVGCGCGSFVKYARARGVKAVGIDFAEWAIANPLGGAEKWISLGDARDIPFPDDSFDFVFNTDLMEHIYFKGDTGKDVDRVIDELCRVSSKWIFYQIATVGMEDKPSEGYFLERDEPIPLELEAYAVAGHVTVQKPEWWEERILREGWRHRHDIVDKFRRLVKPPELIAFWRTIFVLERWPR